MPNLQQNVNSPSINMLNIAHLNFNHLLNKVPYLSVFVHQTNTYHLFGVTESRLNDNISNDMLAIQNYTIFRRDAISSGQTGIAVYIHHSIKSYVNRRQDLESDLVEIL